MTRPVVNLSRPMTGFQVSAECPRCPGALRYVAPGIRTGTTSRCLVRCESCRRSFQAVMALVPIDVIRA